MKRESELSQLVWWANPLSPELDEKQAQELLKQDRPKNVAKYLNQSPSGA